MISILFGGPSSPEHDISILTGLQCERALSTNGHPVQSIYWSRAGGFVLLPLGLEAKDFFEGVPRRSVTLMLQLGDESGFYRQAGLRKRLLEVGTVLNCCHGGPGEAGVINSILDLCGVASTGGPPWASMLGMDKLAFSGLAHYLGIPVLPRIALGPTTAAPDFPPPFIVKPRFGGSSLGIQIAGDLQTAIELRKSYLPLRNGAVLEPYRRHAVDLNLAFKTSPTLEFSLLEKPLRNPDNEFYDFSAKYMRGGGLQASPRELPARVSTSVEAKSKEYATYLISQAGFTGVGRIDFLLEGEDLYLNEINTIPGAMALYLWPEEVGFDELLLGMASEANRQPNWHAIGSEEDPGAALRVASGISEKLVHNRGR